MKIEQMHHVGVVVGDLAAATRFFTALGLEASDSWEAGGPPVERIIGVTGVQCRCAFVATPDGHSQLELIEYTSPATPPSDAGAPSNALGLRHLCFRTDDFDATFASVQAEGAELVGDMVEFGGYKLAYLRGPEGIIVELAEQRA